MKKTLLTLFTLVLAMFTASAQTNLIENGDFETWAEGAPVNWKSTTTASSATLEESAVAHSGAKAVLVKGAPGKNKRLAYKELDLKAGTYNLDFFAKAATAEGASVCPGYAPLKADGKLGNYAYGNYTQVTGDAWVAVHHEFTLAADTKLNIVVMNAKKPGLDVIIDDFSLTLADGSNPNPNPNPDPKPEPQPEGDVAFSADFANDMCGFTIDNKSLSEGLTEVWSYNAKYKSMKASAAVGSAHTPHASEAWAVSPVIDLTKIKNATLTFVNKANFFGSTENFNAACTVKVKAEGETAWTNAVVVNGATGMSWDKVTSTADLKAFDGKKIQIAFAYTSTTEFAGTWEFVNVKVAAKGGEVKPEPQPEPQPEDGAIFSEPFAENQGAFTIEDKLMPEGSKFIWKYSSYKGQAYMKASAFFGGKGHASESWLVSPVIDLTKATECSLSFGNAANFFKGTFATACSVKVKVEGGQWSDLAVVDMPAKDSWTFVTSTADLKAFDGKKIQIAFVYTSTAEKSGTWEVNNVKVFGKTQTGIEAVEAENGAQVIYDLSGRRVAKAVKGLYIINGKKVFVK